MKSIEEVFQPLKIAHRGYCRRQFSCWESAPGYRKTSRTCSLKQGQFISCQLNTRKSLLIELHATLPYKEQLVKTVSSRRNYTTLYANLTPKQAKKLKNLAKKQDKSESEVLRQVIDVYLKGIENKGLPYEPLRKLSFTGYEILPRTITKEQDKKLREIAEKTGRKMTELVREAAEEFA